MLIPWFYSVVSEILRRVFGSKRVANGEWRRLHNEELHSLYGSPNIEMGRSYSQIGSTFKILTGKLTKGTFRKA